MNLISAAHRMRARFGPQTTRRQQIQALGTVRFAVGLNIGPIRGRIQSLQPLISSGTLRLSRRHNTLVDQLRYFPLGAHDDGPDALEMAVSAAGQGPSEPVKVTLIRNPRPMIHDDPRYQKYARQLFGM